MQFFDIQLKNKIIGKFQIKEYIKKLFERIKSNEKKN